MYKCVIFDADGTLFDTSEGICECINYVLNLQKMKLLSKSELVKFIGPPVFQSFKKICKISDEEARKLTQMYRTYYVNEFYKKSILYFGMIDFLKELKENKIITGIATMKTQEQIDKLLEYQKVDQYFDLVSGVSEGISKKEDLILKVINNFHISTTNDVVMIGDTILDEKSAFNIKIDFVGVSYGFGFKKKDDLICNSHILVDSVSQLKEKILK